MNMAWGFETLVVDDYDDDSAKLEGVQDVENVEEPEGVKEE